MTTFAPDKAFLLKYTPKQLIIADAPSLKVINLAYTDVTAQKWLIAHLTILSEMSGVQQKLTDNQMENIAMMIVQNYPDLKISELWLFFHQFKCGEYGKFYGAVDSLHIMASLKEFRNYLCGIYERHHKELEAQREAEERKHSMICPEWFKKKWGKLLKQITP